MGAWSTSAAHEARDGRRQPSRAKDDSARRPIEAEANRLVETYADTILRVSYTDLRSTQDAEDVLLKALGHAGSFDSVEHERAWIIRVAINAAKDLLRRRDRQGTVALDDIAEPVAPMGATDRELEARAEGVLELVMALPLEYREAIYLHYYEEYSIKQIAAIVHASESAVATRLSRGRSKLRPTLEGARYEFDL